MSEKLDKAGFKTKVFNWESSQTWKYEGDLPAIVDFYADWCGPCKMLSPVLDEVAKKYEGKLHVYKVNTDEEPELSQMFEVQSIPTILFIPKEGDPRFAMGALPKKDIERAVGEVLGVS